MHKYEDIKCTIIQNEADFQAALAFIADNNVLGFDLETTGVQFRKTDMVVGFGISNATEGYYLPVVEYDKDLDNLIPLYGCEVVPELLEALNGKKLLAWNGAFEAAFCHYKHQWDFIANFHADCMLMLHTANENLYNYGLKECSEQEFGAVAIIAQQIMLASMKDNGGSGYEYCKASTSSLGNYCIWDCVLTVWWYNLLTPKLEADQLTDMFYNEVMELYKHVTIPMEWRGIRMDMPLLERAKAELREDIRVVHRKVQDAIAPHLELFEDWFLNKDYPPARTGTFAQGIAEYFELPLPKTAAGRYSMAEKNLLELPDSHAKRVLLEQEYLTPQEIRTIQGLLWWHEQQPFMFKLTSNYHMKKLFFDTLKETPLSKTPTGEPQVDDDFLQSVAHKYQWVKDWQVYNKLTKIMGSYLERFSDAAEGDRFYPRFMQHRTLSGRYGSDFQQLPKLKDEDGVMIAEDALVAKHNNVIRNLFIADEGRVLIDADYESLEPHIFAHVSNDPAVREIFERGWDFYSTICIRTEKLLDYSPDKQAVNYLGKLRPDKRQDSKEYGLGICYGETAYKLQFSLGISIEAAEKIERGYWAGFPELAKVSELSRQECLEQGFVRVETGRIRRYPRAKQLYAKYGKVILHDLELWKAFNEQPGIYAQAKRDRRELKKCLNNSVNVKIQGLAASIINKASIVINKEFKAQGLDAIIVAQIHDELLISASKEHAPIAAKIMQEKMENNYKLSIPLKAVPIIGTRYGEVK